MTIRIAAILIATLIFSTQVTADEIDLTVDPAQSSVQMSIGGDSDTSTISGTGRIDLIPPGLPINSAQLTALDLVLDDGISLSFLGGFVSATVTPGDGTLTLVAPGPAGTVRYPEFQFDQFNNEAAFGGTLDVFDPLGLAGGTRSVDMSTLDNSFFDLIGVQMTVVGDQLTVEADFSLEIEVQPGLILTATGSVVSTGTLPPVPIYVAPTELTVLQGLLGSGSVAELAESDNSDLSVRRNPAGISAITEVEIKGTTLGTQPTSIEFTFEASVFARSAVTQSIFMFNYVTNSYEEMDVRPAQRFNDQIVVVAPTGDPTRFVEPGTGCLKTLLRFRSGVARQLFTANMDQALWTLTY